MLCISSPYGSILLHTEFRFMPCSGGLTTPRVATKQLTRPPVGSKAEIANGCARWRKHRSPRRETPLQQQQRPKTTAFLVASFDFRDSNASRATPARVLFARCSAKLAIQLAGSPTTEPVVATRSRNRLLIWPTGIDPARLKRVRP